MSDVSFCGINVSVLNCVLSSLYSCVTLFFFVVVVCFIFDMEICGLFRKIHSVALFFKLRFE